LTELKNRWEKGKRKKEKGRVKVPPPTDILSSSFFN